MQTLSSPIEIGFSREILVRFLNKRWTLYEVRHPEPDDPEHQFYSLERGAARKLFYADSPGNPIYIFRPTVKNEFERDPIAVNAAKSVIEKLSFQPNIETDSGKLYLDHISFHEDMADFVGFRRLPMGSSPLAKATIHYDDLALQLECNLGPDLGDSINHQRLVETSRMPIFPDNPAY